MENMHGNNRAGEGRPDQHVSALAERAAIAERLDTLARLVDEAPKSRGWRLRDRIGERRRWYPGPRGGRLGYTSDRRVGIHALSCGTTG